ncbi:uncharacterized protein [Haliotis asinina]|uniref:uncharacterized protein n=1 Tax=Haliotis asinina TaxID=109174 RepID=UPI0035319D4E
MNKGAFDLICTKLQDCLKASDEAVRQPLDVRKKVGIAIYWMASTSEYRTVGNLFGVGESTVCKCIHEVCQTICDLLLPEYVIFPLNEDLKDVIRGIEHKWCFPNCAGAIDGCHIPIIAPREAHGDYLNRKGWYSLILQAVCDDKYIFRDTNIGWPGRVHDARVFSNSEIFQKGEESRLFPKWYKKVSLSDKDVQLPVVILGDPAYPLRSWLLKPFPNRGALSSSQRVFNSRLSSARMTIENSLGRLKGRWRCLQKRLDVGVEFSCTVIAACVVLHNICEIHNQRFDDIWHVEEPLQGDMEDDGQEDAADQPGKVTRDNVVQAFTELCCNP